LSTTTKPLRLEDDVRARLDKPADATRRSQSFLAAEAIRDTEAAIEEANAGDFAGDAEVAALAKKWKLNAGC
jgi:RHH-type transcriptional regulator, rel operon repressor / antitoxin RelB